MCPVLQIKYIKMRDFSAINDSKCKFLKSHNLVGVWQKSGWKYKNIKMIFFRLKWLVASHIWGPSITQYANLSLGTIIVNHVDVTECVWGGFVEMRNGHLYWPTELTGAERREERGEEKNKEEERQQWTLERKHGRRYVGVICEWMERFLKGLGVFALFLSFF